jgi:hypothetical protein
MAPKRWMASVILAAYGSGSTVSSGGPNAIGSIACPRLTSRKQKSEGASSLRSWRPPVTAYFAGLLGGYPSKQVLTATASRLRRS